VRLARAHAPKPDRQAVQCLIPYRGTAGAASCRTTLPYIQSPLDIDSHGSASTGDTSLAPCRSLAQGSNYPDPGSCPGLACTGKSRLHPIRLTSWEASTSTWLWSSCSLILLPCKVRHVVHGGLVTVTLLKSVVCTPNRSLTPHFKPQGRYTPIPIPLPIPGPMIPRPGRCCLYLPNFNPGARVYRRQRFSSRSYWCCMDITRVCFHNHPSQQVAH
jgi:hypothetical protein